MSDRFTRNADKGTLKILSGATASAMYSTRGHAMFGVYVPSTFDGASLAVEVSVDGASFGPLVDSAGTTVTKAVTANTYHELPPSLAMWPYFRLVANTAQLTTDTLLVIVAKA